MPSNILSRTVCIWFLFFVLTPVICLCADLEDKLNPQKDVLSLLESIQFKNDIVFCGIKIPLDRQDVKERLEKEMLLALWDRPQVILWIKRSTRFFPHVEKILREYNLPPDLKYVPVVESGLRAHAGSSKGAVGFWQFLRSTGRRYDLRIDSKVDERRNIFKSTHAACKYLKAMEKQFGSYLLALSAYNMGEYGLEKEIEVQKNNEYFSLYLSLETQQYLFKIIAAKLIFENQEKYGFYLSPADLYPLFVFDQVNFESGHEIPITLIAEAAFEPFKIIKDYNPELRGYTIDKGTTTILLPMGKAKLFKQNFSAYYKNWDKTYKTKFHVVRDGDSLTGIAKKYNMSLPLLLKLNHLTVKGVIHPGDKLVIE